MASGEGGLKVLSTAQCASLRASHLHQRRARKTAGSFLTHVGGWLDKNYDHYMANHAVRGLLYRLDYRRRRGMMKIPPLNEERKSRIRRFLVDIAGSLVEQDVHTAVIIYMDESPVHHLHNSARSYSFAADGGVVQDRIGCSRGRGCV